MGVDDPVVGLIPKKLRTKCDCGGEYHQIWVASNDAHYVVNYRCNKCQHNVESLHYKYSELNCPKHHWVFKEWDFKDDENKHSLAHVYLCDRCGRRHEERLDSGAVGLRECADPEDPRVKQSLKWTDDSVRFHLSKEDVAEFWK